MTINPFYIHGVEQTPLRRLLFLGALAGGKAVEDTATGNPLTFLTDLAKPLRSILATWQPHQSGTGDPSPENIRPVVGMDGVNVWQTDVNILDQSRTDYEAGYYNTNGVFTERSNWRTLTFPCGQGQTFTKSGTGWGGNNTFWKDGVFVSGVNGATFTIPSGANQFKVSYDVNSISKLQLEVGETASEYAPYHGTSYYVAFPVLGNNLFDVNAPYKDPDNTASDNRNKRIFTPYTLCKGCSSTNFWNASKVEYSIENGVVKVTSDSYGIGFALPLNPGAYRISCEGDAYRINSIYYAEDGSYISAENSIQNYGMLTVPNDCTITVIMLTSRTSNVEATFSKIMLNSGSSALPYEPYTRTVYGGTLDLTTGVLTADFAVISKKWSEFEYKSTVNGYDFKTLAVPEIVLDAEHGGGNAGNHFCNCMIYSYSTASAGTNHYFINTSNTIAAYMAEETSEDTEVVILAKLATPQTFQLSPTQITALIGNNTMWADADSLSVTYLKKG